ncbi:MAG: zinc transporter ZntB, partial [Parvularculaceae bacterium]|nr:zinc transporter ZntB [Parvularculaceae bacterium]
FGVKDTVGTRLTWEQLQAPDFVTGFDFVWIHLNATAEDTGPFLRRLPDMPPQAISALLAGESRPRMIRFEHGLAVNLRGVNVNPEEEREDLVSLRIWCDARRVITTRRRFVRSIRDTRMVVEAPGGPATSGELVALIASNMTLGVEPQVMEISDLVDGLEDDIVTSSELSLRAKLSAARHDAVVLRRFIAPQRDALSRLANEEIDLFDHKAKTELREVADVVTRMLEEIDATRERAMVLHDQIMDLRSEEMNRNMLILSTAAAIFLPLGFITGLLGINVAGIPGADFHLAFWFVVAFCALIAVGLVAYFRSKDWL